MRFNSVHLEKFGRFTGQNLEFRADARLHIIFGANELGKSTALAAIRALLFGVPEKTPYAFEHKFSELRLGGDIETRDGRRLVFARRKGRRRVLSNAQGTDLPDDTLVHWLGGVGEETFARAFGLDSERLRLGAADLLASRGDSDAILMAAASGLTGLTALRIRLDEEAGKIFNPPAWKDRRLNQMLELRENARKRIAELELGVTRWKTLNDGIDQSAVTYEVVRARQREVSTRLNQMTRLSALAPILRKIDEGERNLAALGTLPDLRAGYGAELTVAMGRAAIAAEATVKATQTRDTSSGELARTIVDDELLARGSDIEARFSELAACNQANRDLPRVQGEADRFITELGEHAVALGLNSADKIEGSEPTSGALAHVADLIKQGEGNAGRIAQNKNIQGKEKDNLRALEIERDAHGALIDPARLREKLSAFGDIRERYERAQIEKATLDQETHSLATQAARLAPAIVELNRIATASLPSAQTIARYQKSFEEIAASVRDARRIAEGIAGAIASLDARLAELDAKGAVPTLERIAAARAQRDELYKVLRAGLFGDVKALAGEALASAAARFESAMAYADRLADDGARDATRVAAWYAAQQARTDKQRDAERTTSEIVHLQGLSATQEAEWIEAWTKAGLTPLSPQEMNDWLTRLAGLLQRRDELAQRSARVDAIFADIASLANPLARLAQEAGLQTIDGLDVGRLAMRIGERIKALADPWEAARNNERAIIDARRRVEKLEQERADLHADQCALVAQWNAAITTLGIRADASIAEVNAALAVWAKAPNARRERDNRLARVAGMLRQIAEFEKGVTDLVAAFAPDLGALAPTASIATLNTRLADARTADARRGEIARRLAEAEAALMQANADSLEADKSVTTLATSLPDECDLAGFAARLIQLEKTRANLSDLRAQLAEQSDHIEEARLRDELASLDPDRANTEREELEAESESLAAQANQAFSQKSRLERELKALGDGVGAEVALQQQRSAEAELQVIARDWAVLKIASLMLARSLEKHRETRRNPMLIRASEIFAILTGGQFVAIIEAFDDEDRPHIAGQRSGGEVVNIVGESEKDRSPMSTGTLDQLYLALRLAYVEDYCSRAEPIPFIGDDLFTSFDDARTGFGIDALASLSANTQPILFTHHRHVVDLARARLGDALDLIELS